MRVVKKGGYKELEQKREEDAAARKLRSQSRRRRRAKKEKVEQCKKNLWVFPCTTDGEVWIARPSEMSRGWNLLGAQAKDSERP